MPAPSAEAGPAVFWDYDPNDRHRRGQAQLARLRRVKKTPGADRAAAGRGTSPAGARRAFSALPTTEARRCGGRPRRTPLSPVAERETSPGPELTDRPPPHRAVLAGLSRQSRCALRAVPAAQIHDTSGPKLKGCLTEDSVAAYQHTCLDANIEEWYELLGPDLTFISEFVRMDADDARMLIRGVEAFQATGNPTLSAADAARLAALEARLAAAIAAVETAPGAGAFVKTSCRSAKDAAPALAAFRAEYEAALARLPPLAPGAAAAGGDNARLIAMLEAGAAMLRAPSAAAATASLLRSERVFQDMRMALDHPARFNEHLVARQWVPMEPDMEFRGFVSNGKLTALSQYNHLAHFERLPAMMPGLVRRIETFYTERVAPRLAAAFPRCVVDFAVTGGELDRIWVIEVNPFLETTDAALFSWSRDRALLEGTAPPPAAVAWRVTRAAKAGAMSLVQREWREACR